FSSPGTGPSGGESRSRQATPGDFEVLGADVDADRAAAELDGDRERGAGAGEGVEDDAVRRARGTDRDAAEVGREDGGVGVGAAGVLGDDLPDVAGLAALRVVGQDAEAALGDLCRAARDGLDLGMGRSLLPADEHAEVRELAAANARQRTVEGLKGGSLLF